MASNEIEVNIHTISFEAQMAGWSQTHNGGCKLTLWLNEEDLDKFKLMTVKKGNCAGQRLMCVVVEVGDDEQPKPQDRDRRPGALLQSSIMLAKDEHFQKFALEYDDGPMVGLSAEEHAANCIRRFCRVDSRKELDGSADAKALFARLMAIYREWQAEAG